MGPLRGGEATRIMVRPDGGQLAEVAALAEQGVLLPVVGTEVALADARAAHQAGERGRTRGKIVLLVD